MADFLRQDLRMMRLLGVLCAWAMLENWGISQTEGEAKTNGNAKITAVRNQVERDGTGTNRAADVGDTVRAGELVKTGEQGLAELKGEGDTTVRIGEKSRATFDPTNRQVKVDQGTVLIHAPAKEGPMKVEAGGVTITVEENSGPTGAQGADQKK
jgi:ferric-dicitrate binding protein FerR (iron transport regulator)